jgi:hypothetical protein
VFAGTDPNRASLACTFHNPFGARYYLLVRSLCPTQALNMVDQSSYHWRNPSISPGNQLTHETMNIGTWMGLPYRSINTDGTNFATRDENHDNGYTFGGGRELIHHDAFLQSETMRLPIQPRVIFGHSYPLSAKPTETPQTEFDIRLTSSLSRVALDYSSGNDFQDMGLNAESVTVGSTNRWPTHAADQSSLVADPNETDESNAIRARIARLPPNKRSVLPNSSDIEVVRYCLVLLEWAIRAEEGKQTLEPEWDIAEKLLDPKLKPVASKGPGSRHGHENFKCLWPGCNKEVKRRTNAVSHLLVHVRYKPFVCQQWFVQVLYDSSAHELKIPSDQ